MQLDQSFPSQKNPPVITLLNPLFHPLVNQETLVFDTSSAFPTWSENEHIYELLKFLKYALENVDYCCAQVQRPPNSPAVEMYNSERQKFLEISREAVTKSVNEVFASNPLEEKPDHAFAFDKAVVEDDLHEQILENMKSLSDKTDSFPFIYERRG